MTTGTAPTAVRALLDTVAAAAGPADDLIFVTALVDEALERNPGVEPTTDPDPAAAAAVDETVDQHPLTPRLDRLSRPSDWRDQQLYARRQWFFEEHSPSPPGPELIDFRHVDVLGERAMPRADFCTSSSIADDICATALFMVADYNYNLCIGEEYRWRLPVTPDARVYDLDGARAWLQLEATFGIPGKQFDRIIDWNQFADAYDALRVTWRGVVATQGIVYHTPRGQLAPSWWDTESFMPTRWCFLDATRLPNRP